MTLTTGLTKRTFPGVGKRVRDIRTASNLTVAVAAVRGSTSPATWLQLENFDIASTRTLNNVCRVFACTVDELVGRAGEGA